MGFLFGRCIFQGPRPFNWRSSSIARRDTKPIGFLLFSLSDSLEDGSKDEATAGNIVQVNTAKKVALWYFSILELGRLWCDTMWHPICLIQHRDFESIQGGVSATVKAVISSIDNENLQHGFPVDLDDGPHLLKLQMSFMLGDMNALRAGLDLKGSAGIRPCVLCKNIAKQNSQLSDINPMISGKEVFPKGTSTVTVYDDVPEEDTTVAIADFTKLSLKVEYDGLASSHLKSAWYQRCHQRNFRK